MPKKGTGKKKFELNGDNGKALRDKKRDLETRIRESVKEMELKISLSSESGDISPYMFKSWREKIDAKLKGLERAVTNAQTKATFEQQKAEENARRPIRFTIKEVECSSQGDDSREGARK